MRGKGAQFRKTYNARCMHKNAVHKYIKFDVAIWLTDYIDTLYFLEQVLYKNPV